MQKVTPFLWFDNKAEEAMKFYVSIFKNSKILGPMTFQLEGQEFFAFNGGPHFSFTPAISLFVNCGMWFERFVIIATSLARDFLPTSWGYYSPSIVEIFTFFGTFGVFSVLFLLFIRFCPIMAVAELKAVTPQADPHADLHHTGLPDDVTGPDSTQPAHG